MSRVSTANYYSLPHVIGKVLKVVERLPGHNAGVKVLLQQNVTNGHVLRKHKCRILVTILVPDIFRSNFDTVNRHSKNPP